MDEMEKFELTAEQKQQADAARAAGKRGVQVTLTKQQQDYMQKVHEEESAGYILEQVIPKLRHRIAELETTVKRLVADLTELRSER